MEVSSCKVPCLHFTAAVRSSHMPAYFHMLHSRCPAGQHTGAYDKALESYKYDDEDRATGGSGSGSSSAE